MPGLRLEVVTMAFSRSAFALAALMTASACGDTGSEVVAIEEHATITGTVYGEGLTPVTWMAGTSSGYTFNRAEWISDHTVVKIVDTERDCGESDFPEMLSGPRNSLLLDLFDDPTQPDSRVTQPATFEVSGNTGPISSSQRAIATFRHGASSGTNFIMTAQSGLVTVMTVSADGISGTFDLVFLDGDRLTGSFGALFCETPFPPVSIQTPGQIPEMEKLEINVQFVGCSPTEVVMEAESNTARTTSYFSELEDGLWQLDSSLPTGGAYAATITAKDDEGKPLVDVSLEFDLNKGSPVEFDTVVTCAGPPD